MKHKHDHGYKALFSHAGLLKELISTLDEIIAIVQKEQPDVCKEFIRWLYFTQGDNDTNTIASIEHAVTEVPEMLAAKLKRWQENILQQGIHQGMEQGIQEGLKKGMQKGIQKGIHEARIETAKKLKAKGFSTQEIADLTGLTAEEIEKL